MPEVRCDLSLRPEAATRPFPDACRRKFLIFGIGAAGTTAAGPALAMPILIAQSADSGSASEGYRLTDHVRRYYATTRR